MGQEEGVGEEGGNKFMKELLGNILSSSSCKSDTLHYAHAALPIKMCQLEN